MAGTVDLGKVVGDPGAGIPSGGSDGQVIVKNGSTDYSGRWEQRVKSINGVMPDSANNILLEEVGFARNLISKNAQMNIAEFTERMAGGETAISDGDAWISVIKGRRKISSGTIVQSAPTGFKASGWNLYNSTAGYARVLKYSGTYGFLVGVPNGSAPPMVKFSTTPDGEKSNITVTGGAFTITEDGYISMAGTVSVPVYILATKSDWTGGYSGDYTDYAESTIDLSSVMTNFPYGLMQAGTVCDEINLTKQLAISRVERETNNESNLAAAAASGRQYEYDSSYIYIERETPVVYAINVSGKYTANAHGMEWITGTTVAPYVEIIYGKNYVDIIETDVVTKSGGLANNLTTSSPGKALDARAGADLANRTIFPTIENKVVTTLAGLKSKLESIVQGMGLLEVRNDRFQVTTSFDYFNTGIYTANISTTGTSGYWTAIIYGMGRETGIIHVINNNGTYEFYDMRMNNGQVLDCGTVISTNKKELTFTGGNTYAELIVKGTDSSRDYFGLIRAGSSNSYKLEIHKGDDITVSINSGKITIESSNVSSASKVMLLILSGDRSRVTVTDVEVT